MGLIIQLLISMVFSAFFSGMEIAFVSSNKLRFEMEKTNNVSSHILSVFYRHSNNFISTMLVGNNIALVIYGILMAQLIEQYILAGVITNQAILVPIETIVSTLIILVTGEFMPKTLFKINPNATLKIFCLPTFACYILLYPISRFSSWLSTGILHMVGIRTNKEDREKAFTKVDLDYFIQSSIEEAKEGNEIDNEIKIFRNALDFSNVKIRDCMIPRTEIIAVEVDTPLDELKKVFIENGISKVIVYKDNIDNIIGYIHSSEMFKGADEWQNNIRTIPFVPETMAAHKLMRIFKQQKRSLAVVVDEFGGVSGIVALEDLIEEILGDIEDEHDTNSVVARKISDNEYILSGRMEIEKANETFNLNLPESDDYQTIGGLILNECQSIPKVNEVIKTDQFTFKIIKVSATRIELVKLFVQK
ncbi:hemolysin family protein [Phocaeicola sp.]|mgnify:FL=1|jgi:CBS domain containing-hemolysin-like protein|uniref:hemolysin family protein n=1 Tax=Phocaeicola sp. TaxID=2773926 RepID=UPI00283FC620|nr:hemolysin family protein [Phocaeicola sp.]MDR3795177.1 hemolysin family protein [Phocaeicola sp.]